MKKTKNLFWHFLLYTLVLVSLTSITICGQDQAEKIQSAMKKVWPNKAVKVEGPRRLTDTKTGGWADTYQVILGNDTGNRITSEFTTLSVTQYFPNVALSGPGKKKDRFYIDALKDYASLEVEKVNFGGSQGTQTTNSKFVCGNLLVVLSYQKGTDNLDDPAFQQKMLEESKTLSKRIAQMLLAEEACIPGSQTQTVTSDINKKLKLSVVSAGEDVEIRRPGGNWELLSLGDEVPVGAEISTGLSTVSLEITGEGYSPGDNIIMLTSSSQVRLDKLTEFNSALEAQIYLKLGKVVNRLNPRKAGGTDFSVKSPIPTAGVEGTTFAVSYDQKSGIGSVQVSEGTVMAGNAKTGEKILLTAGMQVFMSAAGIRKPQPFNENLEEELNRTGKDGQSKTTGKISLVSKSKGPRLVLREIVNEFYDTSTLRVENVNLNAKQGYVDFTVDYRGNCREEYRFEYQFDQDLSVLEFAKGGAVNRKAIRDYGFDVSLKVLKGGCKRENNQNPFGKGTAINGGFSGILHRKFKNEPETYKKRVKLIGGNSPRVYSYPGKGVKYFGNGRGKFVTYEFNKSYDSYYAWLAFSIAAKGHYEIAFIYQQEN